MKHVESLRAQEMATVAEQMVWLKPHVAMRRLVIGRPALNSLIAAGKLTVRSVPGSRPLVLAADVDRIAEESTRRAQAPAHENGARKDTTPSGPR